MKYSLLMKGVFTHTTVIPESGLLLQYERQRILVVILSLTRSGIPPEMIDVIVKSILFTTPSYGMDPVLFAFYFIGKHSDIRRLTEETLPKDTIPFTRRVPCSTPLWRLAGSSMMHRKVNTATWYPNDWDFWGKHTESNEEINVFFQSLFRGDVAPKCTTTEYIFHYHSEIIPRSFKWTFGKITINVILEDKPLIKFDALKCASFMIPPWNHVRNVNMTYDYNHILFDPESDRRLLVYKHRCGDSFTVIETTYRGELADKGIIKLIMQ